MYYVNKLVGFCTNPFCVGMLMIFIGILLWRVRRLSFGFILGAFVWCWIWSMPAMCRWTGLALEKPWLDAGGRVPTAESFPSAGAIVLLSGGMCANTNVTDQGEICMGGDRARFAAQLYHAGKAPKIVLTGLGSRESTIPFMIDLGVPESAMLVDNVSLNTEENAAFISKLFDGAHTNILLVTSAFHMRRSVLMFQKYAPELEVIPAPSDFEVLATCSEDLCPADFLPSAGALARNGIHIKEFVGYWGYKLLRR